MNATLIALTLTAGLILSFSVAALMEELIFDGITRLFFVPKAVASNAADRK